MRRQSRNGKQGTVRGFRQGLGPGEGESWVQGRTKTGQNVEKDMQWGQGKALGKISLTLVKNVTFSFLLKLFYFNCSYSLFLLACFAHSFPPGI